MLAQELHATAPSGNPRMLRLNEAVAGLVRPGSPSPRPFGSVHRRPILPYANELGQWPLSTYIVIRTIRGYGATGNGP
jgi:hypothetical protein